MRWRFDSSELCKTNADHFARIDRWVKRQSVSSATTWETFLRGLPGFYPLDVWVSLERCGISTDSLATHSNGLSRGTYREPFPGSLEHPLDYEWRFTHESIGTILDNLRREIGHIKQPSIVCLGCPSIVTAGEEVQSSWNWTLVDKRANQLRTTTKFAKLVCCDLTKETPEIEKQDAAVLDPPWYMPITKHFLARAKKMLKPGGVLFLSFPPEGTRPRAKIELEELVDWCAMGGLNMVEGDATHLYYKTPFFEWNSLISAGFTARVPAWRRADMIMFRAEHFNGKSLDSSEEVPQYLSANWKEFVIKGIKTCVNISPIAAGLQNESGRGLQPVWIEEVLPTVSTTFSGRKGANVVTSGNRFFFGNRPDLAEIALKNLAMGNEKSSRNAPQAHYTETFKRVIQAEIEERQVYLNYLYD